MSRSSSSDDLKCGVEAASVVEPAAAVATAAAARLPAAANPEQLRAVVTSSMADARHHASAVHVPTSEASTSYDGMTFVSVRLAALLVPLYCARLQLLP